LEKQRGNLGSLISAPGGAAALSRNLDAAPWTSSRNGDRPVRTSGPPRGPGAWARGDCSAKRHRHI